jgi:predicted transcriptional regulator of viral defense system
MDDKRAKRRSAGALAELAARQHGVVSARQLYSLGLTREQLAGRTRNGWLKRLHRGVYAVGYRPLTREGVWMAAVLAIGKGTVLSHRSAADLWTIWGSKPNAPVHVTVPSGSGRATRSGIVVHRYAALTANDVTRRHGIPVTTPARTLLDLATALPRRPLERAIDEAERLRLYDLADLREILARHAGRPGAGTLRAVLGSHAVGSTVTRSELEERFLALCAERCLPPPLVNAPLLDYIVDFHWPASRLVVEVDGHASHDTRRAFQADRDRDSCLAAHGYRTLRFTWWDVTARPAVVADRVRRVLAVRSEATGQGEPGPGA